jgi:hypothetical protein
MGLNRLNARKLLASLIKAEVPGLQNVYDYLASSFTGESPVVFVASGPSNRTAFTNRGSRATFVLLAHVFVLHSDTESGWTEAQAEDMLDNIEHYIATCIENHQVTDYWVAVDWDSQSIVDRVVVAGVPYLFELIPLRLEATL